MNKEKSQNELGTIIIQKNVIASIAAIAAAEIDGVKKIGKSFNVSLMALMGKSDDQSRGVRVQIDKNNEVMIQIPLVVKYGYSVPEIADRVQENVSSAMEKMTNLTIKDISINIQGIEKT